MMVQKILVAVDHSDLGKKVLATAQSLGLKYQAELMIIHVLTPDEETSSLFIPADVTEFYNTSTVELNLAAWQKQWEAYCAQNLQLLQRFTQESEAQGLKVNYQQLIGHPGKLICQTGESWGADVIVIGHRGRSGLKELFLGSVSNYVVHHGSCSIFMVQTPPTST
ncbi:MAG: universal stress protein [Synechococcaceae cyanobacterium RL_1_2]|nr:universal stress protein [Synechococcaceae cyanobacterium RL_1_2]